MMNACGFYIGDGNFFGLKCSGSTKIEFLFIIPAQLRVPEYQDGTVLRQAWEESIDFIKRLGV